MTKTTEAKSLDGFIMPPVGVEPTLPKKLDFESSASANSATEACLVTLPFAGEREKEF